jgi:hypothetical protein
VLWQAAAGLPRALGRRKVISPAVENMQLLLDVATAKLSPRSSGHHPA